MAVRMCLCVLLLHIVGKKTPLSRICFPEYIFYTQTRLHSYKHTYILHIHTVLHSYKYMSFYWIFPIYYKKQFDILLLCILCYTVRARSLLKSMHFLLVVTPSGRLCSDLDRTSRPRLRRAVSQCRNTSLSRSDLVQ